MKIGVISDTHRHIHDINNLMDKFKDADLIIHLGDNVEDAKKIEQNYKNEVISVQGNCDFENISPLELIKEVEGKKIFITHGHLYNVKRDLNNIRYRALELEVDIVLFGHTHIVCNEYIDDILFFNPGSASIPRSGAQSVGIINIKDNGITTQIIDINNF